MCVILVGIESVVDITQAGRARVQQQCARRIRMGGVTVGFFFERVTLFPHREREQRAHDYAAFTAASTVQKLEWQLSRRWRDGFVFFSRKIRERVLRNFITAQMTHFI